MYCVFVEKCRKEGTEPYCEGNCVMWFDKETQDALDDGAKRKRTGAGFVHCQNFHEGKPEPEKKEQVRKLKERINDKINRLNQNFTNVKDESLKNEIKSSLASILDVQEYVDEIFPDCVEKEDIRNAPDFVAFFGKMFDKEMKAYAKKLVNESSQVEPEKEKKEAIK